VCQCVGGGAGAQSIIYAYILDEIAGVPLLGLPAVGLQYSVSYVCNSGS